MAYPHAMRGRDNETGEYLGPSRKQRRRDALDVLALAQRLGDMSSTELNQLPLAQEWLAHFTELRRMSAHGARKRQLAYIAKQLRNADEAVLDAIRDALEAGGESARRETALLHRAETWRERLLSEGDAALDALIQQYPGAQRQQLRQLVRNALDERVKHKPPRAYRDLFRNVRQVIGADDAQES